MSTTPVIQVLSKNNYQEQHLVSLPNAPLPALAPSSIRIQTSILSLTANTLTYGRIGHILGSWAFHPLPPSIPDEYSDPTKFGRIPAWGYGTVIESNVSEIEVGTQLFGFVPIGTLPLDMQIRINPEIPGQFFEVSKHREKLLPIYNRYMFYPPLQPTREQKQNQGYDSLYQILFETSYLINRYVFPWNSTEFIHPGTVEDSWTIEQGSLDDKSIVLIFAGSGKTALALAYLLKQGRPIGRKPRLVFGVGSTGSRAFAQSTGLYDKTLSYDADSNDLNLEHELGLSKDTKVVICDFGSRASAATRWATKLRQTHGIVVQLNIAGEVLPESPEKATERFLASIKEAARVNASAARDQAVKAVGEKSYFEEFLKEWSLFKESGLIKGLNLVWGEGINNVAKGWEKLCKGEVSQDQGLVFSL